MKKAGNIIWGMMGPKNPPPCPSCAKKDEIIKADEVLLWEVLFWHKMLNLEDEDDEKYVDFITCIESRLEGKV